jgi:hypothetical protein
MLQVFYLDVAKIDLDVEHMFQVFAGIFCECVYLNIAYVCNDFLMFFQTFSQVFQMLVSNVSSVFFCMLQLLHLYVSKVDRVLHIECTWEAGGSADDVRGSVGDVRR